jgi:hypothetical protein
MSKKTIGRLYFCGLGVGIISIIIEVSTQSPYPLILIPLAFVLALISWIGALIKTAQYGEWGWFFAIFFLLGFALFFYALLGLSSLPEISPSDMSKRRDDLMQKHNPIHWTD